MCLKSTTTISISFFEKQHLLSTLTFVNTHLPIDFKDKQFGMKRKMRVLKTVVQRALIANKITPKNRHFIFIAGDLNMRFNKIESKESNELNDENDDMISLSSDDASDASSFTSLENASIDQLADYNEKINGFKGIALGTSETIFKEGATGCTNFDSCMKYLQPTCKMNHIKSETTTEIATNIWTSRVKLQKHPTLSWKTILPGSSLDPYNRARMPAYCDRILYTSSPYVWAHDILSFRESPGSDHDAIYQDFVIDIGNLSNE